MKWELYEVWSVDPDGHESLVDTTKDLKEARTMAKQALTEGAIQCIIYRETADGDLAVFEKLPL
jgi:hypothetical protein